MLKKHTVGNADLENSLETYVETSLHSLTFCFHYKSGHGILQWMLAWLMSAGSLTPRIRFFFEILVHSTYFPNSISFTDTDIICVIALVPFPSPALDHGSLIVATVPGT